MECLSNEPTPYNFIQPTGDQDRREANEVVRCLFLGKGYDLYNSFCIGTGHYSEVVSALHCATQKQVAIKVINRTSSSTDYVRRFLPKELGIWKRVNHVNIVSLLAHYEYQNYVFLSMEYGPSGDLLNYVMTNGRTLEPKASLWMSQICRAIEYLHHNQIVHRDLKLENIIVFSEKLVKLADFGFATLVKNGRYSNTYCGSKAYSAPEILHGTPYDPYKSDIWSLGVVSFVMVFDMMPFSERMPNEQFIQYQKHRRYYYPTPNVAPASCLFAIDAMLTYFPHERPSIDDVLKFEWPVYVSELSAE